MGEQGITDKPADGLFPGDRTIQVPTRRFIPCICERKEDVMDRVILLRIRRVKPRQREQNVVLKSDTIVSRERHIDPEVGGSLRDE